MKPQPITIRRATVSDSELLSAIASKTFYDTFIDTCTAADMDSFLKTNFSPAALAKELENPNDLCFFLEENGTPIAYIRFMEDYTSLPLMKQWKSLELKRIYVLKEHHGKGIAQQLMDFMLAYVQEHNYKAVWLGVWEHNYKAQKFYEKYGFSNSGHTHDFPIGDTPQTDVWMWRFWE